MKQIAFLLLLFSALQLFAQKDDGLHYIKNAQPITENFKDIFFYTSLKIPFKDILVIDKRFDTSKIGYTNSNAFKIKTELPWSDILNNYFRNNLDPSSKKTLVVVIKSFWLQRGVIEKILNKKVILKNGISSLDNGGRCSADIDIYVKSEDIFQALFRLDTFFINLSKNFRRNTINEFFFLPFDSLGRKLATINLTSLLEKRRKNNFADLINYYDKRFNIPILNDPFIKKGVFLTFDDFKNNKPSETTFRLQEGKLTDELYLGDPQNERVLDSYWGFFDGIIYI